MMIGMVVQMVAMMGSTEAHILLDTFFSNRQILYVIRCFHVKPPLVSPQLSDPCVAGHDFAQAAVGGSDNMRDALARLNIRRSAINRHKS